VKYKEAGFGKSAAYRSMDEKMLGLLAYCINYIFTRKIKDEIEKLISCTVSLCAKVF